MKQTKPNPRTAPENPLNTASLEKRIRRRAHEIYQASDGAIGRELDHWLQAEREIKAEVDPLADV